MSDETGRKLLLSTFAIVVCVLTWSELKTYKRVPQPSRYVGAGLGWGILGFVTPVMGATFTGVFSCGLLLMLLYQTMKAPSSTGVGQKTTTST